MMADDHLTLSLLFKRITIQISNWFKTNLQLFTSHPVSMLTEVLDAIESKGTWQPETLLRVLNDLKLSSLSPLVSTRVPVAPRVPSAHQDPVTCRADVMFLNTNFIPQF